MNSPRGCGSAPRVARAKLVAGAEGPTVDRDRTQLWCRTDLRSASPCGRSRTSTRGIAVSIV